MFSALVMAIAAAIVVAAIIGAIVLAVATAADAIRGIISLIRVPATAAIVAAIRAILSMPIMLHNTV